MLGEPARTQMDLNFNFFGFPVRVSAWFWLLAIILGWGGSQGAVVRSEGQFPVYLFLILWIIAVFISILVHELGHAFAFRFYGINSHIVLYQFGGLTIPTETFSAWRPTRSEDPKNTIIISAAGPLAGFVLAGLVIGVLLAFGYHIPFVFNVLGLPTPPQITKELPPLASFFFFNMILINIFWGILNLLPIYPLDGGQISRSLFVIFGGRNAVPNSLILSIAVAAALALYVLSSGNFILGLLLASLGYSNYQMYTAFTSRRGPW